MRHLKKGHTLGRNTSHRKATFQALSVALIKEKRIQTTLAKAKALRSFVEPLITKAKTDNSHSRRQVFSSLQNKEAVTTLFNEIGPKVSDRPGGYTRVLKLGFRSGDSADLAMIELVDYNDVKPETIKESRKRTRRAGKSNKPVKEEKLSEKKADPKKEEKKETASPTEATEETKAEDNKLTEEKETKAEPKEKSETPGSEKKGSDLESKEDNSARK